jgi:ketosteroid isomerase-like protein
MSDEYALRAAHGAYYHAFAERDSAAMAEAWAVAEDLSCVHPGWPPLFGREAILASYRDIFRNPGQLDVERSRETVFIHGQDARVLCIEKVGDALLVATNCFRFVDGRWRLVHHQASPVAAATQAAQPRVTRH